MGAKKTRVHKLEVTVRFDKPIYRRDAVKAFNNHVYGEFYSDAFGEPWEVLKLGKAK
jgi:hypothetical protein